ncbi:MAG: AAA family ATPase [Nitrospira sp.]|nr:AAA family ATPase [Nitrospira sp.]
MVYPQVIYLNGTSSSGKTTITHKLQELLPRIYLNFSIDSILYTLPGSALFRMTHGQEIFDLNYPQLVRSFNACVGRLAEMGNFLVIDNAITSPEQATDLLARLEGFNVLLVGVHCSLDELSRRERNRQDRTIGEAAAQFHLVHRWFTYDLEVDSSRKSASELAVEIMDYTNGADVLRGRGMTLANLQEQQRE